MANQKECGLETYAVFTPRVIRHDWNSHHYFGANQAFDESKSQVPCPLTGLAFSFSTIRTIFEFGGLEANYKYYERKRESLANSQMIGYLYGPQGTLVKWKYVTLQNDHVSNLVEFGTPIEVAKEMFLPETLQRLFECPKRTITAVLDAPTLPSIIPPPKLTLFLAPTPAFAPTSSPSPSPSPCIVITVPDAGAAGKVRTNNNDARAQGQGQTNKHFAPLVNTTLTFEQMLARNNK